MNDKYHGFGILKIPELFYTYQGEFQDGLKHGQGTEMWDSDCG